MVEKTQHPRNIFEQIALGLEATNANTVAIAEDMAVLFRMVKEIHTALFPVNSEPNASGAENSEE